MTVHESRRVDLKQNQRAARRFRPWLVGILVAAVLAAIAYGVTGRDDGAADATVEVAPPTPLVPPALSTLSGREFFAAPDGIPTNPGTRQAPVDLATALSSNTPALPGDTIWLRGGTYLGNFTSMLEGTESAPFQVRQAVGERVTIAAKTVEQPALTVEGTSTWFRDFEVTLASPADRAPLSVDEIDVRQSGGVLIRGTRIGLLNLVVHDLPRGVEIASGAEGAVVAGNVIYHSGWKTSNQGTGIRAAPGSKDLFILENVVFAQGGPGVSVSMAGGDRLLLQGNVSYGNGVTGEIFDRNILVEGGTIQAVQNFSYYRSGRRGGENNFGYSTGCASIVARGNYWAHPQSYPLNLSKCDGELTANTFIGAVDGAIMTKFPENSYSRIAPKGLRTFVRTNPYDFNRMHVVIYNWDRHDVINVDVTDAKVTPGMRYVVRDVHNLFGDAVASGTYEGGRLSIPVTQLKEAQILGHLSATLGHSAPEFSVFVLTTSSVTPPS